MKITANQTGIVATTMNQLESGKWYRFRFNKDDVIVHVCYETIIFFNLTTGHVGDWKSNLENAKITGVQEIDVKEIKIIC